MKPIPLEVVCPCCDILMKVDPRNGKVIAHGEEAMKPQELGDVVERVEKREGKLLDSFGEALQSEKKRKQELEELFKKATDKAKQDKSEDKPDNPLDDRWR